MPTTLQRGSDNGQPPECRTLGVTSPSMPGLSPDLTAMNRLRTLRVMDTPHPNANRRNQAILNFILETETIAGSQFIKSHGALYAFIGTTKQIMRLPFGRAGEEIANYLDGMYGIAMAGQMGRAVYNHLQSHAHNHAIRSDLRRFAVFDTRTLTAYLSTYDGQMWKIDGGDAPQRVTNGEGDVFFVDDDGGVSVEADIGPHGVLLDTLTNLNYTVGTGGITPEQQRMAMTVWLFALAFPDRMPTKPLLLVEGLPGSGKTAALQLIQLALLGVSRTMVMSKNKEDDLPIQLLRNPIAVFDNTDAYIDWVPDAICAYLTQGGWIKRKLYSDSDEIEIKPHAFVAVASKNPASFRRDDTVDREVLIRLDRRDAFKPLEVLQQEILAQRPQLMGEYIYYLNQIVHHLRVYNDEAGQLETTRMADFAAFVRVVGSVLHWTKEAVEDLLTALANERTAFITEEDPLLDVLHAWAGYIQRGTPNIGRPISIRRLHAELEGHAQTEQIIYKSSARQLAQKIRSPHVLSEFDVELTIEKKQKIYRIWRKTDLRVFNGGLTTGGLTAADIAD
jgi:hypothetical protein